MGTVLSAQLESEGSAGGGAASGPLVQMLSLCLSLSTFLSQQL